ncbi:MAG: transposase [Candidatus Omnitrophica bacterium]|nr:transposase [Candidatus Omnitrophota bacterium]MBU4302943.1 transposase [Candidatus Omnitrophota bacterium]MBU4467379.1 transposase [Candidatus Omnitrophota bacterium]MCG2708473.1 transposase [Candidatus Omnitrophota bacterium]
MREGFDNRNRRSIRLVGYDYSRAGYYFVTVCVNERRNLFGDIDGGEMTLNDVGIMVENNWNKLKQRFQFVDLDEFIVMPNHLHGVIVIVGAPLVGAQNGDVIADDDGATTRVAPTLGDIIGAFKSITTNEYIRNVKNENWLPFDEYFWQRNYYEHVIRNDNDLNRIREYIVNNPVQWKEDEYYVDNYGRDSSE